MPILKYPRNRFGYGNDDAMERVLFDTIAPTTDYGNLIEAGSCNMVMGYQNIIVQMRAVQATHRTRVNLGKQVIHAIITFSDIEQQLIQHDYCILKRFCAIVSHYYGCLGFQNVYGIRREFDGQIHVEFTINSVNYITRGKMICSNALQMEHEAVMVGIFNLIVAEQRVMESTYESMEPAFYEI